ncbi:MAG: hypothetical protein K0S55_346 [Clostridia bacterium]|nr:hypothetical protein [Clostridia bacterium]
MGEAPDNLKDKLAQETKVSLDDNELENVSGGFTIILLIHIKAAGLRISVTLYEVHFRI